MKQVKPTDFRIGNYISSPTNGDFIAVVNVCMHSIEAEGNRKDFSNSFLVKKPIPITLTPEILQALGFEDCGDIVYRADPFRRWVLHNVIDGTSNFEVHQYKSGTWVYSIDIDENMHLPNIKYLHTLQNMFFLHAGYDLQLDFTKLGAVIKNRQR